jgi:drug/metabolite transporter (DMT)-like permease
MLGGIGVFGLLDAMNKLLSADHPVWQVLLVRFGVILLVIFALRQVRPGWGGQLGTRHPRVHFARAAAMLGSGVCFFTAFSLLPLIEGYLVFFTSPFLVMVLAAAALREKPAAAAWLWMAVGFGGVAIGLAPGLIEGVSGAAVGYLFAFIGTLCYSVVFVLNRWLASEPGMARVLVWPATLGVVVMLVPGLLTWRAPDAAGWGLLVLNGLLVAVAQVLLTEAFRYGTAARLAPLSYTGLVWSTTYDLLFWGHLPGWAAVVGAVVVVLACLMSERAARQAPG